MMCTGCEYLNNDNPELKDNQYFVVYLCSHPGIKRKDVIMNGLKGNIIFRTFIEKNNLDKELGKVPQPIWCPIIENEDIYE